MRLVCKKGYFLGLKESSLFDLKKFYYEGSMYKKILIYGVLCLIYTIQSSTSQLEVSNQRGDFLQLSIDDLPKQYQSLEYLKVCSLFAENKNSIGMMQLYKKLVYEKRFPKEILVHIFEYLMPSCFWINANHKKEVTEFIAIQHSDIKKVLPPTVLSYSVLPFFLNRVRVYYKFVNQEAVFIPEHIKAPSWGIRIFVLPGCTPESAFIACRKIGLVHPKDTFMHVTQEGAEPRYNLFCYDLLKPLVTHLMFRSFNGLLYVAYPKNREANIIRSVVSEEALAGQMEMCHRFHLAFSAEATESSITKKNSVTIYDRSHDNAIMSTFEFDDYIRRSFCSGQSLVVELIDEHISHITEGIKEMYLHTPEHPSPKNHRIEIYDLHTKQRVRIIPLPLIKPYALNLYSYSLAYVNADALYLYDHGNKRHISFPYKDCTVKELMSPDSDRFF
jgi:hypothetical protein